MIATIHTEVLADNSVIYDVVLRHEGKTERIIECTSYDEAEHTAMQLNTNKKALTRAEIQASYRTRKAAMTGRVQRSFYIDQSNLDALNAFLTSKHIGQGQFSSKQGEELSDVVNRALANFFRKR